jgi:glycosyltransferase involved in cell wall biosynthesis
MTTLSADGSNIDASRPLRIGINALYLLPGEVGGTEVYLRFLLGAFARSGRFHRWFLFINRETDDELRPQSGQFEIVRCPVRARARPARILYEQFALPFLIRRHKIDVLLNPGFTAPAFAGCPSVTVFHDLQHKRFPGFFSRIDLPFWNLLLWVAAHRSRRLIAISPATAGDLEYYYPGTAKKAVTLPHGVDPRMFEIGAEREARQQDGQEPFLLTVATSHPHKNLDGLMRAFRQFHDKHPAYRLVIAGMKGFVFDQCVHLCRSLGLEKSVTFTGWIPRADLYTLYANASCFILPSRFEGFGMPLAEALAAGIPSACSDIAPLRWVGDGAAHYFDPLSMNAVCEALERIAFDEEFRAAAKLNGPRQAGRFDWDKTAAQTLDVLVSAARQR